MSHLTRKWLAALLFCTVAQADEVWIVNGDRLTGEVVRTDANALRLKTDYVGTLEVPWEQVERVKLDEPGTVRLLNGDLLQFYSISRDGEQLVMQQGKDTPGEVLDLASIDAIEPEPWELGDGYKLSGRVNLALENESGNSEQDELDLEYQFNSRWKSSEFLSFGELEYDTTRGFRSADNWTVFNNLDHTFSGKWFYSGALAFKKDRFADLKLRTLAGPGLGYRFHDSESLNLRVEAGPYYLKDNFYEQPDETFWGLAWYVDYDQFVWKQRLQLYHRQLGFAAANDSDKFLWRAWTGVRIPLVLGFFASGEYEVDYDSEPAFEAETTDTTLKLKIGYKW